MRLEGPTCVSKCLQWVAEHGPSLAKKYKGKRVSAIVEQVRDGSSLRVLLPDGFQVRWWTNLFVDVFDVRRS